MRKTILLFLSLLSVTTVSARERTWAEKQQAALGVLQTKKQAKGFGISAERISLLEENDMLSIIGNDNIGFAIVPNDDIFPAVIGYSYTGYKSEKNPALKWYLNTAMESMKRIKNEGRNYAPIAPSGDVRQKVEHLLTTTWNQGAPYYNLGPTQENGSHYPTGCVATATSQIMKFYNYPEHGTGQKQYSFQPSAGVGELLYANFENTTYDWSNMIDDYETTSYTTAQANAVATIMLHCGVAVEMNYTPSGSGAYSSEVRYALIRFFNYNKNLGLYDRNYYSIEQWMNLIFTELSNNRPIYYAGNDPGSGGHAFVLEGYNSEGYVYVNWGWGADGGNGYYDIALLNPNGYSFSSAQNMIIGISPEVCCDFESHIVSDYPMNVAKVSTFLNVQPATTSSMWNLCGDAWEGKLGIILEGNGNTYELKTVDVTKTGYLFNVMSNTSSDLGGMISVYPSNIADGNYRLYIGAKGENDNRWRLVRRAEGLTNSYIVTFVNGKPTTLTPDNDDTWPLTTGISTISANTPETNVSSVWYTIDGQRLNGEPTQRGIYIHNGQKFVVK